MSSIINYIKNAPVPERTKSYTPVSHSNVIDCVESVLSSNNFEVIKRNYDCSINANVFRAKYEIHHNTDSELNLMIGFMNSYDKTSTFKFAVGANVIVCGNGMVVGDMSSYKRKHTGIADNLILGQIRTSVESANQKLNTLVTVKELMKNITITQKEQSELAGRLFIEKEIITASQVVILKNEIKKPSYDYGTNNNTVWDFFNHNTHAVKETHPRQWLNKHIELSNWIVNEFGILVEEQEEELIIID